MAFAGGNHRGRVLSSLSGTTMPASTTTSKSVEDTGILSGHWEPPPRVVTKCDCVWHIDNLVVRADFESANLSDASCSSSTSVPELLVRTRPDCAGTEFETSNKSWFYFSVQGMSSGDAMRVTVANLNKQAKLFVGGFKPVYRVFNRKTGRGSGRWRRVAGELNYDAQVKGDFRITFDFPSAAVRGMGMKRIDDTQLALLRRDFVRVLKFTFACVDSTCVLLLSSLDCSFLDATFTCIRVSVYVYDGTLRTYNVVVA